MINKANNYQKRLVWLYDKDHFENPFIRIAVETLVNDGYSVLILDGAKDSNVTNSYQHITVWNPSKLFLGHFRIRGYWRVRSRIKLLLMLWYTLMWCPSVIVATRPSPATVGWLSAKLLRSRLIYYPFELYGEQHSKFSPFWKRMESQVLKSGIHALIAPNEKRAAIYIQERGSCVTPIVVHNYKPKRSVVYSGKLRDVLQLPETCRIILYEGQLVHGRWLENLVQSVTYLPDDTRLVLMGTEKARWLKKAESLLKTPEIAKKTLVAPRVPDTELLDYVSDADVGIIIYDDQVRNNYYCEPGKLSDYVLARVPVVAPNFPTIGPVVSRYSIGHVFDSPEPTKIAHAIRSVLSTSKQVWEPALKRASEYLIWETQSPHFLEVIAGP